MKLLQEMSDDSASFPWEWLIGIAVPLLVLGIAAIWKKYWPESRPVKLWRDTTLSIAKKTSSWPWTTLERLTPFVVSIGSAAIFEIDPSIWISIVAHAFLLSMAVVVITIQNKSQISRGYSFENRYIRLSEWEKVQNIREELSRHIGKNDTVRVTFWGLQKDVRNKPIRFTSIARQSLMGSVVEFGWPQMKLTYGVCGVGYNETRTNWTMPECSPDPDTEFKHSHQKFRISRAEFDALQLKAKTISTRQVRLEPDVAALLVVESEYREQAQNVMSLADAIMRDQRLLFRVTVFNLLHTEQEPLGFSEGMEEWEQ